MLGRSALIGGTICALVLAFPPPSVSLALRGLEQGEKVPDMDLAGISGEGGKLSSFSGEKGLVVIYWATWSSRSPAILQFAEKELRRYETLGVKFLAVNADHQEMRAEDIAAVKAMSANLGLSYPVVLDSGLKGYNDIGIISTPTTLILDRDLKVVDAYPGFPSAARDDIPDRIDAFLGIAPEKLPEKTRYLLDHQPRNHALPYYNLGKNMFLLARSPSGELRSVPEAAIERLDEAIRRDPDFFRPYLLKAIIYDMTKAGAQRDAVLRELSKRDFQEVYEQRVLGFGYLYMGMDALAADHFRILSSQAPDDPGVLFGQAVVAAWKGDGAAARKALDALGRNPATPEALGFDCAALFSESGELKPGAEGNLRSALGLLLGLEKKTEGAIRKDAPVQGGPSAAPASREVQADSTQGTR